jgi:peptidoglycan/LPS O-acetylase OafA/YrhL
MSSSLPVDESSRTFRRYLRSIRRKPGFALGLGSVICIGVATAVQHGVGEVIEVLVGTVVITGVLIWLLAMRARRQRARGLKSRRLPR